MGDDEGTGEEGIEGEEGVVAVPGRPVDEIRLLAPIPAPVTRVCTGVEEEGIELGLGGERRRRPLPRHGRVLPQLVQLAPRTRTPFQRLQ